jgi:hypothetical protein
MDPRPCYRSDPVTLETSGLVHLVKKPDCVRRRTPVPETSVRTSINIIVGTPSWSRRAHDRAWGPGVSDAPKRVASATGRLVPITMAPFPR